VCFLIGFDLTPQYGLAWIKVSHLRDSAFFGLYLASEQIRQINL
jgi:hypothetical protein